MGLQGADQISNERDVRLEQNAHEFGSGKLKIKLVVILLLDHSVVFIVEVLIIVFLLFIPALVRLVVLSNRLKRLVDDANSLLSELLNFLLGHKSLANLIDNAATLLRPGMHVRVNLDIEISYEEANFIKETFIRDHNLREMSLIPNKNSGVDTDMAPGEIKFESVDQIVTDQITNIESEFYDSKLLLRIYQNL